MTSYATLDEAAVAAETAAMLVTKSYEFGGVIFTAAGKFYFTPAMTSKGTHSINVTARFAGHLVAIYHTHPGPETSNLAFSEDDVRTSTGMKVPSFIGVMYDGSIHKFTPGVSRTQESRRMGGSISYGNVM